MVRARQTAVAGSFYPADAQVLRDTVHRHLEAAREAPAGVAPPKALIVPHAGYVYSGPVAAKAFARLLPLREKVRRVVLIGPSHHVAFRGLAVPSHAAFETPLGLIPIDDEGRRTLVESAHTTVRDDAHRWEHSVEVQLPFLQQALGPFRLLPIVVGRASPDDVSAALDAVWGGDETLVVVSSDLSHYQDYATAKRMDAVTAAAIEGLRPDAIGHEDACGCIAVAGLLRSARVHALVVETLDLRSSGDTAGGRDEVVGYGAWALTASRNGSQ